jgi:hypothetical protein
VVGFEGEHPITGDMRLGELARPLRIKLHQEKAAAVMDDRNVGVVLLKEAPVLHNDVEALTGSTRRAFL